MHKNNQISRLPAKVVGNDVVCDGVCRVELRLPGWANPRWQAGQYLDVLLDNGLRRSFSMANLPNADGKIILYIQKVADGFFSDYLFNHLTLNTIWTIELPLGAFTLSQKASACTRPLLLLGVSTGIAPLYAMLQLAEQLKLQQNILLYWGQREKQQFFLDNELRQLTAKMANADYIPVVSRPERKIPSDNSYVGYVQNVAIDTLKTLGDFEIYLCGGDSFITQATKACLQAGAKPQSLNIDRFTYQNRVYA